MLKMNYLNHTNVMRFVAYAALTLCIFVGALTYASSVMANSDITAIQNAPSNLKQSDSKKDFTIKTAANHSTETNLTTVAFSTNTSNATYAETALSENIRYSSLEQRMDNTTTQSKGHLLPVLTWFLGSAALAMFGYKRMRHEDS